MRAFEELSAAELATVEGIAFDIDDTVTRDGRIEATSLDALWRLHAAGVPAIAATGRPLGWAEVCARMWPIAACVGENGEGWVWTRARAVHRGYAVEPKEVRAAQRDALVRIAEGLTAAFPELVAVDARTRECDIAFDIGEAQRLDRSRVRAAAAFAESLGARTVTSNVHLHIALGDATKTTGIVSAARDALALAEQGVRTRWVFVGDSPNDAPAFRDFAISVGVANVARHLAALAHRPRFVTRAEHGAGFAEVVDALLRARGVRT